jgi:signal transduction histidine kinase
LVEELFELSKLEAKDKIPNFEDFSIAELIQDIHMKNDMLAKKRNIELKCELEENLPYVNADIAMMEKALQNLIDNAFKFTKEGGKIVLGAEMSADKILVSVCDNGIGISEENKEQGDGFRFGNC